MNQYHGIEQVNFKVSDLLTQSDSVKILANKLKLNLYFKEKYPKAYQCLDRTTKWYAKSRMQDVKKEEAKTKMFESTVPQTYDFKDVQNILDDEGTFDGLNYGEQLNCARIFADECCKDLGIPPAQVYFADFNDEGQKYGRYVFDSNIILIDYLCSADEMKLTVPHEVKHYHQDLILRGERPHSAPSNETIYVWYKDEFETRTAYANQPTEIDADEYTVDFDTRNFKPFRELQVLRQEIKLAKGQLRPTSPKLAKSVFIKRNVLMGGESG